MASGREGQIGMNANTLLTVEQVPLDQLRPDPANPRRIGDEELEALERSIRPSRSDSTRDEYRRSNQGDIIGQSPG